MTHQALEAIPQPEKTELRVFHGMKNRTPPLIFHSREMSSKHLNPHTGSIPEAKRKVNMNTSTHLLTQACKELLFHLRIGSIPEACIRIPPQGRVFVYGVTYMCTYM